MNIALKSLLIKLFNKKYIGGRHTQEHKLIIIKTKWLTKYEKRNFEKEYKLMVNQEFILKIKKKTHKGIDWHISLNPKKLKELRGILK